MILVHGMYTSAPSLGLIALGLSTTQRVILVDLFDFDFGYSRSKTRCATFEDHIHIVHHVCKSLNLNKVCITNGNEMKK
jgi:hypothetical protein